MNIVMVAAHACIRVHKMAIPLIERGHSVHLIAMKVPVFWEQYKTFIYCVDTEQVLEAIKLHANGGKVDVFHCHNEPSWFVTAVKESTNIPVVLDVHDSYLTRSTPDEATEAMDKGEFHVRITAEERNNFQLADALVFPGDDFRKGIVSEFGLEQPCLTLPSYVPRRFYKYSGRDWHGGLAYEGRVNLPDETVREHTGFAYCDYTDMVDRTSAMNMDFHLYAGRNDEKFRKHYGKAFIHKGLGYEELLAAVGRHDWGLVGNSIPTRQWEVAMPNKLFEYMASGVPVASMNAGNCSRFIEATGVGITVSGPDELADRWSEHRESRKKVFKERQDWSMNAHIHELEGFYKGLTS